VRSSHGLGSAGLGSVISKAGAARFISFLQTRTGVFTPVLAQILLFAFRMASNGRPCCLFERRRGASLGTRTWGCRKSCTGTRADNNCT
jgi:hypothetical protein